MKFFPSIFTTLLLGIQLGLSQGFVNLNFEEATFAPSGLGWTNAIMQGWTANPFVVQSNSNTVPYNVFALDSPSVDVHGANSPYFRAIQGQYSVFLQGGSPSAISFNTNGASIGQAGQIPIGTQSIVFWGYFIPGWGNSLQVTFNGQPLSFFSFGGTTNHTVYAADITSYAGQTGLLQFAVSWVSEVMIDNIQFSSDPIPEPNVVALTGLGTLIFAYCRRRG